MIHKDNIIPVLAHQLNGLLPALGFRKVKGIHLQKPSGYLAVDQIVIHNKHLHVRSGKGLAMLLLRLEQLRRLRDGTPVHNPLGNRDGDSGPFAVITFHTDGTAHQLHQMLNDRQPQAGTLHASVSLGIHLTEILKNFFQIFLRNTAARILHPKRKQLLILPGTGFTGNAGPHIALLCKLDGIVEDIDQYLLNPSLVPPVAAGKRIVAFILQNQSPFGGRHVHHSHHLVYYGFQVVVRFHQFHLTRLNFRQIQNVVDDSQQIPGRRLHILGVGVDSRVFALFHDDFIQPDDGVHGSADFMGHVGQKLALCDVRLFRLLPHSLNLIDIGLDVRHIKNQNDAPLLPAVFVNDLLAVALIVLPVDRKAPGNILV